MPILNNLNGVSVKVADTQKLITHFIENRHRNHVYDNYEEMLLKI